ncbi:MAG: ABC transporter substrate-binding protein [Alphaproteobacteria bacterium]
MRKAFLSSLTLAIAGALAAIFAGDAARAADQVDIAVIAPLSGPNASVGEMIVNASKLAAEDINNAGGIKSLGGAKVNLIIADATNDPQGAITTTERVLTQSKVAGAFGLALSPLTTAALPAFVKHHVPVITSAISDALVTPSNGGYLFQIAPKGSAFGNQEVEFLKFLNEKYKMGITKAAILYVNNPYGIATEKGIEQLAQKAGLDIVLNSPYPENITDASPLVSKVQQSGAQVLFPVSYISDSGLLLTALRSANSHVLVIGGGAGFIWPPIGQSLGDKVNGLTSVSSWNLDSKNIKDDPKLAAVAERYSKTYNTFMPEQAGEAYAGVSVLAAAVEAAGSADPAKVRLALQTLDVKSGGGALMQPGEVSFDANGANTHVTPVMIQWQNNVPHTVFPEAVATSAVTKP